jgi:hypothetical protein
MYYRAALIQARLELVNGRQGCMVRVLLPMSL